MNRKKVLGITYLIVMCRLGLTNEGRKRIIGAITQIVSKVVGNLS